MWIIALNEQIGADPRTSFILRVVLLFSFLHGWELRERGGQGAIYLNCGNIYLCGCRVLCSQRIERSCEQSHGYVAFRLCQMDWCYRVGHDVVFGKGTIILRLILIRVHTPKCNPVEVWSVVFAWTSAWWGVFFIYFTFFTRQIWTQTQKTSLLNPISVMTEIIAKCSGHLTDLSPRSLVWPPAEMRIKSCLFHIYIIVNSKST